MEKKPQAFHIGHIHTQSFPNHISKQHVTDPILAGSQDHFFKKKQEVDHATLYSNWFWIDFLPIIKNEREDYTKGADLTNKGSGMFIHISVDDVDGFHRELLSKGLKPATKPQDQPWGNREFILRDPDGYILVIFKRK